MIFDKKKHTAQMDVPDQKDFMKWWLYSKGKLLADDYGHQTLRDFLLVNEEVYLSWGLVSFDIERKNIFGILMKMPEVHIEVCVDEKKYNEAKKEYTLQNIAGYNRYNKALMAYGKTILPHMTKSMHVKIFSLADWSSYEDFCKLENEYENLCHFLHDIDPIMGHNLKRREEK